MELGLEGFRSEELGVWNRRGCRSLGRGVGLGLGRLENWGRGDWG